MLGKLVLMQEENTHLVIVFDVNWTLIFCNDWSSVSMREESTVISRTLANVCRPRPVQTQSNGYIIIAGVGREPQRISRDFARELGLSRRRVFWSASWQSVSRILLLAVRISVSRRSLYVGAVLWMADSTCYGWVIFTQNSVARQS
jgi:hypothetical protein